MLYFILFVIVVILYKISFFKKIRYKSIHYLAKEIAHETKNIEVKEIIEDSLDNDILYSPDSNKILFLKPMWKNIKPFLESQNIIKFYHFTDLRNLKSIIRLGGLKSWSQLDAMHVNYYKQSNRLSRELDLRRGLQNYIRLSFISYHPMVERSIRGGKKIIILQISVDIAYLGETLFSDKNATDRDVNISSKFDFLKTINYSIFQQRYYDLGFIEKKQYQAEILVRDFLPIKYITNINELEREYL